MKLHKLSTRLIIRNTQWQQQTQWYNKPVEIPRVQMIEIPRVKVDIPRIYQPDNTWQRYNQPSYVSPSNWNNNYQNTSLPKYPPPSELFKYQSPVPKVEIYKMDDYTRRLINPIYNQIYRSPSYSTPTYRQPTYTMPSSNYNRRW